MSQQTDGGSSMYKLNKSGPKTDPCRTPIEDWIKAECWWYTLTHWVLSERYDFIKLSSLGEKLNLESLAIRTLWLMVSEAFFRSRNTPPTKPLLSIIDLMFSIK